MNPLIILFDKRIYCFYLNSLKILYYFYIINIYNGIMESLIVDKEKLVDKINQAINLLGEIKNEIVLDNILEEVINVEDVKKSDKFPESEKTLKAPKSKPKIVKYSNEDSYKDFYDINSRPEIHI